MRAMSDNLLDSEQINQKIESSRLDNEKKTLESEIRIIKKIEFLIVCVGFNIGISAAAVLLVWPK